jgi:hypothetical protein
MPERRKQSQANRPMAAPSISAGLSAVPAVSVADLAILDAACMPG